MINQNQNDLRRVKTSIKLSVPPSYCVRVRNGKNCNNNVGTKMTMKDLYRLHIRAMKGSIVFVLKPRKRLKPETTSTHDYLHWKLDFLLHRLILIFECHICSHISVPVSHFMDRQWHRRMCFYLSFSLTANTITWQLQLRFCRISIRLRFRK